MPRTYHPQQTSSSSSIYQSRVHEIRTRPVLSVARSVFGVHSFYDGRPHTSLMTFVERETAVDFARRLDHARRRTGEWPSRTVLQVQQPLLLEDVPDSESDSDAWGERLEVVTTPVWALLDTCEEAGLDLVVIGAMVEHGPRRFSFEATAFRHSEPRDARAWAQRTWEMM